MKTFVFDYSRVLVSAIGSDFSDNWDEDRFGPEPEHAGGWMPAVRRRLRKSGVISTGEAKQTMGTGLGFVEPHVAELEWLYGVLGDDESRDILVRVAAFRALGHRKVRLPMNTPAYWETRRLAGQLPHGSEEIDPNFLGWKLNKRSLESFGYPIKVFSGRGAFATTFVHQQYRCETPGGAIECSEGDVAIDAGGCYGDTALYFAHKAGPGGKVASFEFLPVNLGIYRRNIGLNPELAGRIRLYEHPVWSESGQEMFVSAAGPGTRVLLQTDDPHALKVETLKIDDLICRGDLPRIDFIKMDIEGAEMAALKGAESVLRRFKPKLAITVYHDFRDFWTIPQFLDGLGLGYRFHLRHFTIHAEETVLFAKAVG